MHLKRSERKNVRSERVFTPYDPREKGGFVQKKPAPDFHAFTSKFPGRKPDLLIADLSQFEQYGGQCGVQLVRFHWPGTKVLAHDEGIDFLRMQRYLRAGVHGYIFKDTSTSGLVSGIRQVMTGAKYVCDKGFQMILSNLNPVKHPKVSTEFSASEHEVARCMSEGIETAGIAKRLRTNAAIVKRIQSSVFRKLEMRGSISG